MRVVIVSNRVARPKPNQAIEGGLAAALLQAVQNSGAIWVGTRDSEASAKEPFAEVEALGSGALATIRVPGDPYLRFYQGYANSVLWPVFHGRADLVRAGLEDYEAYRDVNATMARGLMRFLDNDTVFWVHDYHFLTLGQELRRRWVDRPIGFFLHTPFPDPPLFRSVPQHGELARALLDYDLIGFQTETDLKNFSDYVTHELALTVTEGSLVVQAGTRLAVFPIGIDAELFAEHAMKAAALPEVSRLRASLQGSKLAIGVDRIDYSKGIANRLQAFERLFDAYPNLKKKVSLLQIAVPSRGHIDAYCALQAELAAMVGRINGIQGDVDWSPIRYVTKGFPQAVLAGLYRTAQIGLVTPVRDGMNLVAKEYVAAQNPLDPGVLVLSEFAGAAKQLDAALMVNPHDLDGMGRAIVRALDMSIGERRERWESMMRVLQESNLYTWFADFLRALETTRAGPAEVAPAIPAIGPKTVSAVPAATVAKTAVPTAAIRPSRDISATAKH